MGDRYSKTYHGYKCSGDEMKELLYRVEFNEHYQRFHHEYIHSRTIPNTYGWFTIIDESDNAGINQFEAFVYRKRHKKLTVKYLLNCVKELEQLKINLKLWGFEIVETNNYYKGEELDQMMESTQMLEYGNGS